MAGKTNVICKIIADPNSWSSSDMFNSVNLLFSYKGCVASTLHKLRVVGEGLYLALV